MNSTQNSGRRPSPFFKRQYIINPGFQIELTAYFTGALVICLGGFYWGYKQTLAQAEAGCDGIEKTWVPICRQILATQSETLAPMFTFSMIIGLIFIMCGGILLSHRAAGPLFRLKKYFSEIAAGGPLEPIKFRKSDYFHEVTEVINNALAKLTKKS